VTYNVWRGPPARVFAEAGARVGEVGPIATASGRRSCSLESAIAVAGQRLPEKWIRELHVEKEWLTARSVAGM